VTAPERISPNLLVRTAPRRINVLRPVLIGVVLAYVWRVQDLVPGLAALKIPTLITVLAVALALVDPRVSRRLATLRHHRVWRLVPWFAACAVASVAFSIDLRGSVDFLARNFLPSLALALIVPACAFVMRDGERFAAVQVAGAAVYCAVILALFHEDSTGRLGSLIFYDANDLGMLLVCTLPLCMYFVRHGRHVAWRILALAVTVLIGIAIARTGSRGAFVGFVSVVAYLMLFSKGTPSRVRLAIVGVSTALLLFGSGTKYGAMMSTIFHLENDYNWTGDEGRLAIWDRGMGYISERPLTGVGLNAFPVAEGTMSPMARRHEFGSGIKWSAPHNSFVQVGVELGIPALLLFVAVLFRSFMTARRLARDARRTGDARYRCPADLAEAHAATIVGYVVSGSFLSQGYAPYLYFVIGMIIALDATVRAEWAAETASSAPNSSAARARRPRFAWAARGVA
jgi:putative inorganic carbon (HCO3(-)) transporter